ncbi:hypothetical protein ACHRV6_02370 [Flavobacterium sp. FlaQc-51]|uniref:hypothetical protein n=1 Tax=Flavobacterium sp. FlaQc-51 TaxID=3374184 RepID=UPI003756C0DB
MVYHLTKTFLDFISSVSWPITTLIILFSFKKPIIRLLKNIKKVTYGNTEIETTFVNKQRDRTKIDLLTEGIDFSYIDNVLNKFSETSRTTAFQIIENETKISEVEKPQQKYERLLKYSQLLIIVKNAEKIYQLIFGSQIRLLQRLNYSITENSNDLKFYYDSAVEYNPKIYKDYSYKSYLNFLIINDLIILDEEKESLTITDIGKDFLRYLTEANLNLDKLN